MEKIEFKNNSQPYLSAENLNQMQKNVEIYLNDLNDKIQKIVESGKNQNGDYIKFDDGTLICTKNIQGTSTFTQTGNLFYKTVELGNWAYEFKEIINVQTTIKGLAAFGGNIDSFSNTSAGSTRLYKTDGNSISFGIYVLGIGKWK